MQVRYYSEVLNKSFETEEACKFAEKAYERKMNEEKKKKEDKAARRKEIEDMYDELSAIINKISEKEFKYFNDYKECSRVSNSPFSHILEVLWK